MQMQDGVLNLRSIESSSVSPWPSAQILFGVS